MRGRFSDLSCKRHFNADFLKLHRNLKQYLINCKRKCTFYWLAFVIPNISYHLSDLESITTSIKKICQKKALTFLSNSLLYYTKAIDVTKPIMRAFLEKSDDNMKPTHSLA